MRRLGGRKLWILTMGHGVIELMSCGVMKMYWRFEVLLPVSIRVYRRGGSHEVVGWACPCGVQGVVGD